MATPRQHDEDSAPNLPPLDGSDDEGAEHPADADDSSGANEAENEHVGLDVAQGLDTDDAHGSEWIDHSDEDAHPSGAHDDAAGDGSLHFDDEGLDALSEERWTDGSDAAADVDTGELVDELHEHAAVSGDGGEDGIAGEDAEIASFDESVSTLRGDEEAGADELDLGRESAASLEDAPPALQGRTFRMPFQPTMATRGGAGLWVADDSRVAFIAAEPGGAVSSRSARGLRGEIRELAAPGDDERILLARTVEGWFESRDAGETFEAIADELGRGRRWRASIPAPPLEIPLDLPKGLSAERVVDTTDQHGRVVVELGGKRVFWSIPNGPSFSIVTLPAPATAATARWIAVFDEELGRGWMLRVTSGGALEDLGERGETHGPIRWIAADGAAIWFAHDDFITRVTVDAA